MNVRFLIVSIILFLIVLVSEYTTYASLHYAGIIKSARLEIILMILGIIFPIVFISSMLYSYNHYSLFNSWLNTISAVWLGIAFYIFIISIFIFILITINHYLNLNIPIRIISGVLVFMTLVIIFYGIWNASNTKVVRWTINSEQLQKDWSGKKIVIVSDIHLGSIRREKFMQKVVDIIKSENPDITFNLGDIIDGSSFPYEKWFSPFSNLTPELGSYYVEGNHEKFSKEYDVFKSQFPKTLVDLTNKKIIINNTQIIGLDSNDQIMKSRKESEDQIKSELKAVEYDPQMPSIVLVHDPKNAVALSKNGVSLILSGHTHGGQFFPFTIIVNKIYKKYAHGISYTDKTASMTSYGVGTSIIPMRILTTPEIIVLDIK